MHPRPQDHYRNRQHWMFSQRRSQLSTLNSQLPAQRSAFTLVELLVAIAIFSILVTLSLSAFRETDQDRAAAGAQQLRSMIEGARSRAIHDQLPRGIRLLLGSNVPTDPSSRYVTSIVYIGAPEQFAGTLNDLDADGLTRLTVATGANHFTEPGTPGDDDGDSLTDDIDEYGWVNSDDAIVASVDANVGGTPGFTPTWRIRENLWWPTLRRRRLLAHTGEFIGARIKIPAKMNTWFPIVGIESPYLGDAADPDVPTAVRLTIAGQFPLVEPTPRTYPPGGPPATGPQFYAKVDANSEIEYVIELAPPVLPGSVPQPLANGIAIDLDGSRLPSAWSSGGVYGTQLDVLFSPRGEVIGSAAAAGVMHFVIADVEDITNAYLETLDAAPDVLRYQSPDQRAPALLVDPAASGEPTDRLVTLFARTGQVTTSQVNHFDGTLSAYEFGLAGKDAP